MCAKFAGMERLEWMYRTSRLTPDIAVCQVKKFVDTVNTKIWEFYCQWSLQKEANNLLNIELKWFNCLSAVLQFSV